MTARVQHFTKFQLGYTGPVCPTAPDRPIYPIAAQYTEDLSVSDTDTHAGQETTTMLACSYAKDDELLLCACFR